MVKVMERPGDVLGIALEHEEMCLGCYRCFALDGVIYSTLLFVIFGMDWSEKGYQLGSQWCAKPSAKTMTDLTHLS